MATKKPKQVLLSISCGKGPEDIKTQHKAATKAGADKIQLAIGSTSMTKSEVSEALRQLDREIQRMDWPPGK